MTPEALSTPGAPPRDCEDCGRPIAAERLAALPDARHCKRCANERERAQARPVGPPPGFRDS